MAYTIGINKNMNDMFTDLHNLMTQEGWSKSLPNNISSMTTSRGNKYNASGVLSMPGRYSDTVGVRMVPSSTLIHSVYTTVSSPPDIFWTSLPTNFSISFWFNLADYKELAAPGNTVPTYVPNNIAGFTYTGKEGISIGLNKNKVISLANRYPLGPMLEVMDIASPTKTGKEWMHITITIDNSNKLLKYYVSGNLVFSTTLVSTGVPILYPCIFKIYGGTAISYDEIITWDKVLTDVEVLALANKATKVEITDPYVYEKFTYNIGVLYGGYYTKTALNGSPINISILLNTSNNIELNTYIGLPTSESKLSDTGITPYSGSTTAKFMAGVSPISTDLVKYWITVTGERVILAYKLYNPAAVRVTPVYQIGYIGKINSLGNDGNSVFICGSAPNSSYSWTTLSSTTFRSGLQYTTNNIFRLGYSGYVNAVVGNITSSLSNLQSIGNSTFLSAINISYGTHMCGTPHDVFILSSQQAIVEDIITIGATDYVVLDDGDSTSANNYRFAVKLV